MFDGYLRAITDKGVEPIGRGLARIGVTPDHLTILGLVMSVGTAVAIGSGHPLIGFFVLVTSALPDLFDGAVARATGTASMRGAFFDSTADRVTDAFLLGGIGWYLGDTRGFEYAMLAFSVLGVSTLISYMRAKAEIYKLDAKGGLMERAERIIVLCVGLVFAAQLLVPVLWIMLVLTSITAIQRFVKIWNQADRPAVAIRPTASTRRTDAARLRADRQSRVEGSLRLPRTKAEREQLLAEWRTTGLSRRAASGRSARAAAKSNRSRLP
jgi:CDP-diacylglycerol---glycerol-3-phosphate 3-phosphatidyltransferase